MTTSLATNQDQHSADHFGAAAPSMSDAVVPKGPRRRAQAHRSFRKGVPVGTPALNDPEQARILGFWPEAVRGVPNAALRGALFSISRLREHLRKLTLLDTVKNLELRFKGERFNQTDLDVWEMLLHLARREPLGRRVEFSANAFLKALGRSQGRTQHEQLKDEITRLRSGTVEITWIEERKTFGGGLVSKYFYDDVRQRYVVVFDEHVLRLFDSGYSHIDWEQRKRLGNNNLAKWLHGFYASHAQPLPYKVETIRNLCGSKSDQRLGDFRKLLRSALLKLVEVGAIVSWNVDDGDRLVVRKIPTLSQQRHLQKKLETTTNPTAFDSR